MKPLLLTVLLLLGGCAQYDAASVAVAKYGANAADRALEANLWGTCVAVTNGALARKFPTTKRRMMHTWFCNMVATPVAETTGQ